MSANKQLPFRWYWEQLFPVNAAAHPFQPPWLTKPKAWTMLVAGYLACWGWSTYLAFKHIASGPSYIGTRSVSQNLSSASASMAEVVMIVILVGLAIRAFGATPAVAGTIFPRSTKQWLRHARLFCVYTVLPAIGFLCASIIHFMTGSEENDSQSSAMENFGWVPSVLRGIGAGPAEEMFLLLFCVWVLRCSGHTWITVYIAAIVIRLPFHAYYGWETLLGLAIWPLLMVLIYRRVGTVLPAIAAHSFYNLTAQLAKIGDSIGSESLTNLGIFAKYSVIALGVAFILLATNRAVGKKMEQEAQAKMQSTVS